MENRATLGLELCGRHRHIESNVVKLRKVELEFEKFGPECEHVLQGEIVTFRVMIKNKSEMEFRHVEFRDTLDEEFMFIPRSFRVNGRHERARVHGQDIRFRFEHIRPHSEHEICFDVRIGHEREEEENEEGGRPGRPNQGDRPSGRP